MTTTILEIDYLGEPLKIDISDSTTASDVCDFVNDHWPGCARLLLPDINFQKAIAGFNSINESITDQKRKQKSIDRIAWKVEAAQRYQKGGHWR